MNHGSVGHTPFKWNISKLIEYDTFLRFQKFKEIPQKFILNFNIHYTSNSSKFWGYYTVNTLLRSKCTNFGGFHISVNHKFHFKPNKYFFFEFFYAKLKNENSETTCSTDIFPGPSNWCPQINVIPVIWTFQEKN